MNPLLKEVQFLTQKNCKYMLSPTSTLREEEENNMGQMVC